MGILLHHVYSFKGGSAYLVTLTHDKHFGSPSNPIPMNNHSIRIGVSNPPKKRDFFPKTLSLYIYRLSV
jgi:hypothetical protein